ncbi:unnamed protein product [Nezara viridula]|uniref:Neuropeptide n=1 Tax=Nezara viridula TaxID=85310 RepID=A0A9P0MLG3_NEZVI|nr:unnamed protein product [Nezara viridula]
MQALSPAFLLVLGVHLAIAQDNLNFNNFVDTFANCKWDSPDFDTCIKGALNTCRTYFKTGVPELSISPFDPFFAKEVVQTRGGSNFNYKLKLINVSEYGWSDSIEQQKQAVAPVQPVLSRKVARRGVRVPGEDDEQEHRQQGSMESDSL